MGFFFAPMVDANIRHSTMQSTYSEGATMIATYAQKVKFHCVICGHDWSHKIEVEFRDGEEIVIVRDEDLCPKCTAQGDVVEEPDI